MQTRPTSLCAQKTYLHDKFYQSEKEKSEALLYDTHPSNDSDTIVLNFRGNKLQLANSHLLNLQKAYQGRTGAVFVFIFFPFLRDFMRVELFGIRFIFTCYLLLHSRGYYFFFVHSTMCRIVWTWQESKCEFPIGRSLLCKNLFLLAKIQSEKDTTSEEIFCSLHTGT